ncbi:FMN-binding protein [candidate division WOR-3 bacterium]|nr:FMN-binding protein [candidate division WOR-3 bacterium]
MTKLGKIFFAPYFFLFILEISAFFSADKAFAVDFSENPISDKELNCLQNLFPSSVSFSKALLDTTVYFTAIESYSVSGYAFVGENRGIGGPIITMTGFDVNGFCTGVQVVSHEETPQYFALLEKKNFFGEFSGVNIDSIDVPGKNFMNYSIDAVTGATISSEAVLENFWEGAQLFLFLKRENK